MFSCTQVNFNFPRTEQDEGGHEESDVMPSLKLVFYRSDQSVFCINWNENWFRAGRCIIENRVTIKVLHFILQCIPGSLNWDGLLLSLCFIACMLLYLTLQRKGMLEETGSIPPESVVAPLHNFSFPFFSGKGAVPKILIRRRDKHGSFWKKRKLQCEILPHQYIPVCRTRGCRFVSFTEYNCYYFR